MAHEPAAESNQSQNGLPVTSEMGHSKLKSAFEDAQHAQI